MAEPGDQRAVRSALATRILGVSSSQIRARVKAGLAADHLVPPGVAEAIGAVPHVQAADWQFACKAGTVCSGAM